MKASVIQLVTIVMSFMATVMCGYSTEQMIKATNKAGSSKVIALTEDTFEQYLNGPRDYHVVLLLSSASPKFNCPLCMEFKPEYELVAKSWFQDHPNGIESGEGKDIFFMYAEFMNAKTLFQKMKLNNIPKLFAFPPTTVSTPEAWLDEAVEYQFFQGKHSDIIIEWLKPLTNHKFNVYVPINYNRILINAGITFGVILLIKVFFEHFKTFVTSKYLWMCLSIISTLLFTSGYMFTQIRHAPYTREHPDGHIDYFIAGQQTQLGAETQIVSAAYGALSLLFVILVRKLPEISHPKARFIATTLISTLIYVGFSLFLSFVGLKSPYPLLLLKFF